MLRIDLHCHSTYSDGLLFPGDVVARAARNGAEILALTDHDETGGLAQAAEAAREHGIALINGVEISASWQGHIVHVVGLRIDRENGDLLDGLASIREGRLTRAERIADALGKLGVEGSLAGARKYVTNPNMIGRAHFARYLVEAGYAKDQRSVFRKYLGADKPAFVAHQWASLEDAVGWIKASGGDAVIAHPGRLRAGQAELRALFTEFKDLGGDGIEVVTGSHTTAQFDEFATHARKHEFKASAGSDFHGPLESVRDIGVLPDLPAGLTPIWRDWPEARTLTH